MEVENMMLQVDMLMIEHKGNWTRHNLIEMFKLLELKEIRRILYNRMEAIQ